MLCSTGAETEGTGASSCVCAGGTVPLAGTLEVSTAVETAASTSTAETATTARWPAALPGKSGLRMPIPSDSVSAHTTSRPPAM